MGIGTDCSQDVRPSKSSEGGGYLEGLASANASLWFLMRTSLIYASCSGSCWLNGSASPLLNNLWTAKPTQTKAAAPMMQKSTIKLWEIAMVMN